jgi:hypothetical protein
MIVRFRLGRRDLTAFNLHHLLRSRPLWFIYGAALLYGVSKALSGSRASGSSGHLLASVAAALIVWMGAVALGAGLAMVICIVPRRARNMLTDHSIELTPTGVVEQTSLTRTETQWGGVQRLVVTRRHVFLYIGPSIAHVIPRRSLPGDAAWRGLIEHCRRQMAAAASGAHVGEAEQAD